jgi:2-phospho-L-lactate guanylyltransferase
VLRWSVILPVKRLDAAKSRLAVLDRPALALAMALDTASAALAAASVAAVIVVTDDDLARAELHRIGCRVAPDEPSAGLNPALCHGAAVAHRLGGPTAVAALSADLPALRSRELDRALAAAAHWPHAVVGDRQGTGTTLYAASQPQAFRPMFGADSLRRHAVAGAKELHDPGLAGLRADVDTVSDLTHAATLGLGVYTAELAAASRLVG